MYNELNEPIQVMCMLYHEKKQLFLSPENVLDQNI